MPIRRTFAGGCASAGSDAERIPNARVRMSPTALSIMEALSFRPAEPFVS
jgi:hypothetical protein